VSDAYVTALRMLARRELCEAQVRTRLARREFEPDAIDAAVARLQADRALDDRRTALACARTEANVKRHGRRRALRTVEALGIDRGLARAAVAEVFGDIDEDALLAQALDRKLPPSRTAPAGQGAAVEAAVARRLYRHLLGQGFDAGRVLAAIRNRVKNSIHDD
jgi:SOS response regulatory protein OraA/RecX